jgi:hypothetical protein
MGGGGGACWVWGYVFGGMVVGVVGVVRVRGWCGGSPHALEQSKVCDFGHLRF